ncbi:MAG: DNA adenine methylase [Planctomycetes bacterium]|uniref:DNA adenine methylase n=1 Tax=Candidatus Wunengus californicus TaxID=3367619 RepID=UPI004029099A|nr:DNA adenine methylase [Planctomycetota bacterium]
MITTVKSPVNRMGGKYYLTGWLSQHIPAHVTYVEPFCGAGHLLFSKEPSPVEVINDIDSHLIGFFELLKDDTKRSKLIQILDNMLYSRRLWQDIRSRWKQGNIPVDEMERVSWWFYLNRTCFLSDQCRGGFAVPSTTGRNPVQSFRNTIESLNTIAERLRNVCIENLDYQECIRRYDSKDTLFYCDPPYLNTEDYYGKGCFTLEDHYKLAGLLHDIKGHAMVTHYQNDLYDELYQGWNRYEYQSFKGSHKSEGESKPKTTEVLYTNFEPVKRGLFNETILV